MLVSSVSKPAVMEIVAEGATTTRKKRKQQKTATLAALLSLLLQVIIISWLEKSSCNLRSTFEALALLGRAYSLSK